MRQVRTQSSDLGNATAILLSLETSGGVSVMTHQRVNLLSFGESFVTEPLELAPGTYAITDFLVVNDLSEVLFATPQAGSYLAALVKHPLHFNFTVTASKSVSVAMEVTPVGEHTPEDFGYASFGVKVVRPLSLSVFSTGNAITLVSAKAFIIKGTDTLTTYNVGAKVNLLSFKLNAEESYKLVIVKDGYAPFSRDFIYNDLMTELDGTSLKVYLNEALTFRIKANYGDYMSEFGFFLESIGDANVIVDWGDGVSQTVNVSGNDGRSFHHWYPNATASYFATLTGDLDKIKTWDSNGGDVVLAKINFEHLPILSTVNFFQGGSATLDVTHNSKIQHIVFGGNELLLPVHHNLSIVIIFGEALAPSLDSIINNVAQNAIAKTITNGVFQYSENPDSDSEIGLGTPSPASMSLLETLVYSLQWNTYPMI